MRRKETIEYHEQCDCGTIPLRFMSFAPFFYGFVLFRSPRDAAARVPSDPTMNAPTTVERHWPEGVVWLYASMILFIVKMRTAIASRFPRICRWQHR